MESIGKRYGMHLNPYGIDGESMGIHMVIWNPIGSLRRLQEIHWHPYGIDGKSIRVHVESMGESIRTHMVILHPLESLWSLGIPLESIWKSIGVIHWNP